MTGADSKPRGAGECWDVCSRMVAEDHTLTLVRGWYDDPVWGAREHWWLKRQDGTILDPTSEQFPAGGITDFYRAFQGLYPCEQCGEDTPEEILIGGICCSSRCYGAMVGVYVGALGGDP